MENISLNWWDYLSLISIIFIGIPHGALDGAISITLGYSKQIKLQTLFILTYLFISFIVVIFWFLFPVLALILFLFISVFHFGFGDLNWKNNKFYILNGYFHGGLIVFGIIFFNKVEVDFLFQILSGDDLLLLWKILYLGLILWVISAIILFINYKNIQISKYYLRLLVSITLIVIILPPLPAFAAYFCLIHSFHHIKRIFPTLLNFMDKRKAITFMVLFSFFSWVVGIIGVYYILDFYDFSESVLKVTFIGLAALTVPHMILVDGFFRPKFKI